MNQSIVRVDETIKVDSVVHFLNDRLIINIATNNPKTINDDVVYCTADRVPRVYEEASKIIDEPTTD